MKSRHLFNLQVAHVHPCSEHLDCMILETPPTSQHVRHVRIGVPDSWQHFEICFVDNDNDDTEKEGR